jgi:hypothetical protein
MSARTLRTILGDVPGANGYRYDAKDSAGNRMDTVKIIVNPAGGYLGIYHTGDTVNLATSSDLLHWTFVRALDDQATQPTIRALPTGGFLTAVEFNDQHGSGGRVRFRHYPTLSALYAGTYDRDHTPPRTLSPCNEGTPNIRSVSLSPDIDHSVVEVGFHYHRNCEVDRQAGGRLTDFTTWATAADSAADDALMAAARALGHRVRGNIGDRDSEVLLTPPTRNSLFEIQYRKGDFGSWRVYLRDGGSGEVSYLPITTHGGSTAFANPSLTMITAPSGQKAVVVTMFIPTEGAAPGEAGELIYYSEFTSEGRTPVTGAPNSSGNPEPISSGNPEPIR